MIDHQLHQLFTAYKEGKLDKQQAARMISQLKNQNGEKATTNQYNPTVYTYDEPYLRDHVFDGKRVVLGVTHASLAFNHFFDKHPHEHSAQMRNLTFVQPIILKEHEQVEVLVSDKEKGGAFSISFRHTPNEPWKPTATGEITACSQEAFAIDIQERASQLRPYIDISQLYSAIRKYELGSSFRTVNSLYVSEQESLIELRWPVEVVDSRHHYNLHPLTLNSMIFGVVPQLMHTGNTISFLPVGIKTLTFYKTDRPVAFIRTHTLNQSGDLISFDAEAMDSEGRVLAVVNGYTLKRMSPPMAEDDASSYQAASGPGKLLNENAGKQDKNEQVLLYLKGKIDRKLSKPLSKSHLERNLMDLGIDSVRLVELSVEIEKDTGIELPPTIFFEYPNLKSLSTHLSQNFEKEINQLFSKEASSNIAPSSPAFEGLKKAENSDHIPSPSKKPENSIRLESIPLQNPVPKHNDLGRFSDSSRETASGDIAVIGMDGKVAGSENLEEFWNHLIKQTDLMSKIPSDRFEYTSCNKSSADGQKISCEWGSFINDVDKFDAPFFNISPREASWMDPQLRLLLQSVYACSEDAGYSGNIRGTDTGVFIGACFRDYADKITEAGLPADPYLGTGISASALANRASFVFDLQGPSMAVDTACSSSLLALHLACKALQNKECSLAFVGGVNLMLSSFRHRYFCNIGALSTTGRCHTFDAAADGYVPGEAIVSVLLKPLSEAEKDNDHIYGVIKGSAALHGGYTPSLTAPSVDGEANVVTKAWEKAGIDPATLSYIEAHGTGTALGDPIEINALKKAFKQYTQKEHFCKIGSAKAHIGHTEAAAGLVGLVKVLLQMKHGQIPAMPAFKQVNPLIALEKSPLAINTESQAWESGQMPKRAGVSSFGFTGAYAHVVVEEYLSVNQKNTIAKSAGWDENHSFLILLSARDKDALSRHCKNLHDHLKTIAETHDEPEEEYLQNLAYTLQVCREAMACRVAFVIKSVPELREALQQFLANTEDTEKCFYGEVSKEGNLLLEEDDDLKEVILKWQMKGKWRKIAGLWVQGMMLDWTLLYSETKPSKLSLPTYPFEKKKYWLDFGKKPMRISESTSLPPHDTRYGNDQQEKEVKAAPIPDGQPHKEDSDDITRFLLKQISQATEIPVTQLDLHEEIRNYGFDSIVITKLSAALEQKTGKKDTALFFSSRSIAEVVQKVKGRYGSIFSSGGSEEEVNQTANEQTALAPEWGTAASENEGIAIIGITGRYPQAENLNAFFEILMEGKDCIEEIPQDRWDFEGNAENQNGSQKKSRTQWGGFLPDVNEFDYENFSISFQEALSIHPEERLLLEEAWHCFESAGYDPLHWLNQKKNTIGVYIGASFNDYPHLVSQANRDRKKQIPFTTQSFSYANRLSYFFNLKGPSMTLDTACSSASSAIFEAYNAVKSGRCEAALAGGVNLSLHSHKYAFLEEYNFLSHDGRCRAFAEGGDGYVPGEGVGLVLLKRLDAAVKDNDNILGVIKGAAAGNDGRTNGFTVPNPEAQRDVIENAISKAGVHPDSITCVECHGTGTALGDPIEISALTETFREYTAQSAFCAVSSVKSNIGHLEAAAGIAQLTKMIFQFKHQMLFPNVMHHERLNPQIAFEGSPFFVQRELAEWKKGGTSRRGGISSFGAGGSNVHFVLEEYASVFATEGSEKGIYYLLPFSAASGEQLLQLLKDTYGYLKKESFHKISNPLTINNIAGTLQKGRAMKKHRLAIVSDGAMETFLEHLEYAMESFDDDKGAQRKEIIYGTVGTNGSANSASPYKVPTLDENNLIILAHMWVKGQAVEWPATEKEYQKVILPAYPFKKKKISLENDNNKLEDQLSDGAVAPGDPKTAEAMARVEKALKEVLGVLADDFDEHSDFSDYGIDSIMASRIHGLLSKDYDDLNNLVLFEYSSMEKLANYLYKRYHATSSKPGLKKEMAHQDNKVPLQEEDMTEVGNIQSVKFSEGNDIIPFSEFIEIYESEGGEIKMEVLKVNAGNGHQMEVVVCGQGPAVVLLPPFNSSAIVWIQQLLHLSKDFRLVVIHYPGLGQSDWVEEMHSFSDLAAIITGTLDELVKRQVIPETQVQFVGWSLGGFLAQTLANEYPAYVKKIVLISTTTISWSSDEYNISGEEFSLLAAKEFQENFEKLPDYLKEMPKIQALKKKDEVEKFALATTKRKIINRYFLMIARFRHFDIASDLDLEVLLISGEKDGLMPAKFARRLHMEIKGSEYYEIPGGQHFLSLFNSDIINRKVKNWLREKKKTPTKV